ncbi:flagellar biosynthesis protein FlgD [Rubrivivax gelatinosus]|uniref:Basal-body rod modification protein FlgD n=1 Tax=Rubrivivax gelatinosus TaxID=28068 RepID=A0ABS1DTP3_RUBGE|nr:flagellar hook capping FlgD N-terminal domain-containing protein [Rubrivivax gelatinosus]MBK1614518.1 flagellar biosynthesis protein FlgD [Rubrivivax gelatinosus]MBK1712975.1 flagellar biosynthesis protein FlgD [Rubrivivax gelatinosus]
MSTTVDPYAAINTPAASQNSNSASAGADRFLKLLVAQMQNQDPLNPMDNAQVTSQMAQINTVTGIEKLNETVTGLNSQFLQMQAMQGAALIGRDVTIAGKGLDVRDGVGVGGFDLSGTADKIKVEIVDASGRVADTLDLGAAEAGTHSFTWDASKVADPSGYTFRVTAKLGTATVANTTLMRDTVAAVNTSGNQLQLELLHSGSVDYTAIKAYN